jgi:two-component system, NarL family, response regulator NreC
MSYKIHLMIADDHDIYRDGLKTLLEKCKNFVVVGEAATGKQLIKQCERTVPDVVMTDIMMPVMDGIQATTWLADNLPEVRVLALSMFNQDHLILDMIKAGASGYLIKNAHKEEIIEAIHSVHKNKPYYCSSTSHKLARLIGSSGIGTHLTQKVRFSSIEMDIIRLICEENTTKRIGDMLNMSSRTVEEYRQKIRDKMDVRSTVGMVIYAIQNKLYKPVEKDDQ